ncbi:hypothetical protein [Gordonia hydrophobica]|uniref:TIGR03086 family protein n=1 Tax=Gordonia hydrophobica TaxID=40516 RepID=A0ABZ2U485_9ACTN|nr:hypothetical protein [Gordonia hydrophobica]MBM7367418.1 uncharacterized protein (TIGR03086 family) [Gordonia hydrophobica]
MTALAALTPAQRHRAVAAGFAEEVARTIDWDAQSPVGDWVARDVVAHLLDWFPDFLAADGVHLADVRIGDDPVTAWSTRLAAVQQLFDDPGRDFTHPRIGVFPLAEAIDRFYTADVFMHTWDLAQAGGRTPDLDHDYAEQLLAGLASMERVLRESGQYGPAQQAPDGADAVVRLAAFIGRDPNFAVA